MAARLHALARTIIGPGVANTVTLTSRPTLAAAASNTRSAQIHQHRMASSSTTTTTTGTEVRKFEWLVVIPDKPGMMAKRLEVRPQHFEGLAKAKESGMFKMGGELTLFSFFSFLLMIRSFALHSLFEDYTFCLICLCISSCNTSKMDGGRGTMADIRQVLSWKICLPTMRCRA